MIHAVSSLKKGQFQQPAFYVIWVEWGAYASRWFGSSPKLGSRDSGRRRAGMPRPVDSMAAPATTAGLAVDRLLQLPADGVANPGSQIRRVAYRARVRQFIGAVSGNLPE